MRLRFHTVDVFTTERFAGNPLAIVEEADGLTGDQMQRIAREFNLSETIFIHRPAQPCHAARVRIFLPTAEIPFAGHPTIGCAIHMATRNRPPDTDFEVMLVLEEVAGLVPVRVRRAGGHTQATFTAPVIPHALPHQAPGASQVEAALGLPAGSVGFGRHGIGFFGGGPAFLFVPLADRAVLSRAWPREPQFSELFGSSGIASAYLYCDAGDNRFAARMFAPGKGIAEDPATGSASAILAAQLLASEALLEGTSHFTLRQGEDMGRPSEIGLEIDMASGRLAAVRITGSSVPVGEGVLSAL